MSTPYSRQVAHTFAIAQQFGDAQATSFERNALRAFHNANGRDRTTTLRAIKEGGYPLPIEVTPEMVALTGAAHACGVAIHLAETRGIEGKDSTYESYTAKNRFDRFTALHLPKNLRSSWSAPINRVPDASPKVVYPDGVDTRYIYGVGKPHRYLPAQTMRHLEFARLGKLDNETAVAMHISDIADPSKFAVEWDTLIPVIESATDVIQLAGNIGAEVGRQLLNNGLAPEQVAAILKKSYSTRGIKEEHGDIAEADEVYNALLSSLAASPATETISQLIAGS